MENFLKINFKVLPTPKQQPTDNREQWTDNREQWIEWIVNNFMMEGEEYVTEPGFI